MNVICRPRKNPTELQMAKKIAPGVSKYYCSLVSSTKISYFLIKVNNCTYCHKIYTFCKGIKKIIHDWNM